MKNKKIEKFEELLSQGLDEWDDETCLTYFLAFMPRVLISTEFIQDENGFMTHELMYMRCGDKYVVSEPIPLDWPMEPVIYPDVPKKELN